MDKQNLVCENSDLNLEHQGNYSSLTKEVVDKTAELNSLRLRLNDVLDQLRESEKNLTKAKYQNKYLLD